MDSKQAVGPDGDLIECIDARGNVTRTSCNTYGQPTSQMDVFGNTTSTNYDPRGLSTSVRDANGNLTRLNFDEDGNMTQLTDSKGNLLVTNSYNTYGEVISSTTLNGQSTYFVYDVNGSDKRGPLHSLPMFPNSIMIHPCHFQSCRNTGDGSMLL